MEVIVDGARNFALEGSPTDLLAVLAAADAFMRQQQRMIVSIEVDGAAVRPDQVMDRLKDVPLHAVGVMEIRSEAARELVERCLEELNTHLPELPLACRGLSEVFHGEAPEEGYEPFHDLADIWGHIKERERMVLDALGLDPDTLDVGDATFTAMHAELNQFLQEAVAAMQSNDLILLGDLLEYELAPRAEREVDIVARLREQASALAS
jgi:hypothetical protein